MSIVNLMTGVHTTDVGTPYLKEPQALLIGCTTCDLSSLQPFLDGLGFDDSDYVSEVQDAPLGSGAKLAKFAGQLCYLSFGEKRTHSDRADGYFDNILRSSHESVLEHVSFSFLIWGVSRSLTHELVRHRHLSPSQVSQRYVNTPRFVERPEYVGNTTLHYMFEKRIDEAAHNYRVMASVLENERRGNATFQALPSTERRKAVNQVARSVLPNETEAPLVMTGNARAWRHFLNLRATVHAEPEIRRLALLLYQQLVDVEPLLFKGYTRTEEGGVEVLTREYDI